MIEEKINRSIRVSDDVALVACSYCHGTFKKSANWRKSVDDENLSGSQLISHGICPNCLLKNFPQEYLLIQKDDRLRIKRYFNKKYTKIELR